MWTGNTFPVTGWRDASGVPSLPFPAPVNPPDMDSAVWPKELQADGVFTRKGQIGNWDNPQETTEGDF